MQWDFQRHSLYLSQWSRNFSAAAVRIAASRITYAHFHRFYPLRELFEVTELWYRRQERALRRCNRRTWKKIHAVNRKCDRISIVTFHPPPLCLSDSGTRLYPTSYTTRARNACSRLLVLHRLSASLPHCI